jgi:hypothetical protein
MPLPRKKDDGETGAPVSPSSLAPTSGSLTLRSTRNPIR